MGLVFEPERVGRGDVPAHTDGQAQYDAAAMLGESLTELAAKQDYLSPELHAYMLYGSAAHLIPTANRRSDLDLLVVLENPADETELGKDLAARFRAISSATNVDISPVVYNRSQLEAPVKLNPFYADHLSSVRGVIVNRSFQYFSRPFEKSAEMNRAIFGRLPFVDAWPFALEYLRARRQAFQTQLDQVEQNVAALKGPFELPRNLGRTLCDMFTMYELEHPDVYDPIKDDCSTTARHDVPDWENLLAIAAATDSLGLLEDDVERLHQLNAHYTDLLEATIAGDISVKDYASWLKSVYSEAFERAFKVVSLAENIVHRTVELAMHDPNYDAVEVDQRMIDAWYPENDTYYREFSELEHRAGQVMPLEYDLNSLLFRIAPKYPDMLRRYEENEERRRESRRVSDAILMEGWEEEQRLKQLSIMTWDERQALAQ